MTRLIVDDGGQRRAFKVQDGRLTVGAGPDATLRLQTGEVADLHLDLEVADGRVTLRPRPGVTAPRVNGVPAAGAVELAHGASVQVGGATLRVEYEDGGAAARAPARVPKRPASVVQSRRTRELHSSGGLPSWALVAIVLVVVAVGGFFASKALTSKQTDNIGAAASLLRVHEDLKSGSLESAEKRLKGIASDELDPKTRAKYDEAAAAVAAARAAVDLASYNITGNEYLQTQLKNFESQRLAAKPERPKVRVFLKRCDEFLGRWPQHPEVNWVERMVERYDALYDPTARTTFADIAYEAETLTWANPRDFRQAIEVVRTFADEEATVAERPQALELLDQLLAQRAEWFTDRMQQARHEFDRGELGKSVAWLVMLIVYTGDETMQAQASEQLVKFDGLESWLRGYRINEPEKYAILRQQPALAKYIASHDVE